MKSRVSVTPSAEVAANHASSRGESEGMPRAPTFDSESVAGASC